MPPHDDNMIDPLYRTFIETPPIRWTDDMNATIDTIAETRRLERDRTTRATFNTDGFTFDAPWTIDTNVATKKDLDMLVERLAIKMYKIISEHTRIDISEEEFMHLLTE